MPVSAFLDITKDAPHLINIGEVSLLKSLRTIKSRTSNTSLQALISHFLDLISHKSKICPPWAFLGYHKLGAILNESSNEAGREIIELLTSICDLIEQYPASKRLVSYGDTQYTTHKVWSYLLKLLQDGGNFPDDVEPPDIETFKSIEKTIKETHQLIEKIDPELKILMGKLQGLIIAGQPGILASIKKQSFAGATCFFFRGGTIINSSSTISKARMIERLIHEYAHAELFTIAQKELLCLNSDDETHPVLIRSDPRPMNGIIHSLYVVSRVADFQIKLINNEMYSQSEKDLYQETKRILSEQLLYGKSSLAVIKNHAKLTSLGIKVVETCEKCLSMLAE